MKQHIAWKLMGVRMHWDGDHFRRDWRWRIYRLGARLMDPS